MSSVNPWNNVPVTKIDLKGWLDDNRVPKGHTISYKGKTIEVTGKRFSFKDQPESDIPALQLMHLNGELNLYKPIEAYRQKWFHNNKTETYYPIGERVRDDLPPVYLQWKEDFKRRNRCR